MTTGKRPADKSAKNKRLSLNKRTSRDLRAKGTGPVGGHGRLLNNAGCGATKQSNP